VIESTACVQDDFAAPFCSGDASQFARNSYESGVGSGEQNDVSVQGRLGDRGVWRSGGDRADCGARRGGGLRDDGADSPAEFAETLSEGLSHASGADDGNSA